MPFDKVVCVFGNTAHCGVRFCVDLSDWSNVALHGSTFSNFYQTLLLEVFVLRINTMTFNVLYV